MWWEYGWNELILLSRRRWMFESAKVGKFLKTRFSDEIWDRMNVWQLEESLDANLFAKRLWDYLWNQFLEIYLERKRIWIFAVGRKRMGVSMRERERERMHLNQMKRSTLYNTLFLSIELPNKESCLTLLSDEELFWKMA